MADARLPLLATYKYPIEIAGIPHHFEIPSKISNKLSRESSSGSSVQATIQQVRDLGRFRAVDLLPKLRTQIPDSCYQTSHQIFIFGSLRLVVPPRIYTFVLPESNFECAAFEQEWKCEKLFVQSFLVKPVPCISPASVSPWVSFSCDSSSESPAGRNSAVDGARVKRRRFMEPAAAHFCFVQALFCTDISIVIWVYGIFRTLGYLV
ncbi:hypothetical protein F511_16640 [Dorcoceras hygrometricum]|uniref:Uncharacterized protein n=1 Tax=Dorcoceras hygrometricum TaxID=472368 RepID=A0A2Z7A9E2_9LAMI|nr:hypothetical protein F511_16640 [Dorcoceras hygrometricum]